MFKIFRKIILFLIEIIERYEYRNLKLDQQNELKKVINIIPTNGLYVESDYGFVPVEEINLTQPYNMNVVELEDGNYLECADSHIVYCKGHIEKFVNELSCDDYIITKQGLSKVKTIKKTKHHISMFDLTIDGPEPSYYTNNILSHNTVSAAIVLLHFVLFNNDKGVMIVANKGKTVIEIIRKIKDIYKLLPFYLKKGVVNWNEKSITFDNGCRIQSENRTKEPSIGFTIDFLYLDEFAKVPENIVEAYYGAVVPTVSSISNSKIVITSTPDGFNLFHRLLTDAERDIDDPLKSQYEAMRVYWHQVKGRMDVKLFPLKYKLKEYKITEEELLEELHKLKFNMYEKEENNRLYHYIKWSVNDDRTSISEIRQLRIRNIPITEICVITNWKEEETKLIGGESMFNQEYDLQFVTGDKLLFDTDQMTRFKQDSKEFQYVQFNKLDKKLTLPYNQMKWIKGRPDLFTPEKMKDYHIVASVDLGEGLGQDYSVLNIFRLMPKPKELIESTYRKLSGVYEYFYLEQIGMCRVNNWSIQEFGELFYMVMFELFDSEKSKVVLEYNTYGATFLSELTKIFDGEHDYSTGIFLRYKHRKDDKQFKIGMKITGGENEASKKLLVKELQRSVKKQMIKLHNDININEITKFTKKETTGGNFTYKCDGGHDDCLLPDTQIKTITGYKKIKDIVVGDFVLTHLGNYKEVTNTIVKEFNGDMYKVKYKGQIPLDITYNHPIYSASIINKYQKKKNNYIREWITPDKLVKNKNYCVNIKEKLDKENKNNEIQHTDLYENNKFASNKNIKLKKIILDKKFSKFLGLFLADGNCYKPNETTYRISLAFNKNHINLINEMKDYLESIGLSVVERYINENGLTLTTHSKTLYELLIKCYDNETKEKILPEFALQLNKDLKHVLDYWIIGDGWKVNRKNRESHVIGCSTSIQLILSMKDIATSLGKTTTLTKHKRHRYKVKTKDQYWLSIYDNKPERCSLKQVSDYEIISNLDYSKKYHYSGLTYNIEVKDDNSYVANGIVVHNCVMTLVSLSSVFSHVQYKNLIEDYINNNLTTEEKNVIDKYAYHKSEDKVNYDITKKMHKNVYKNGNKKPPRRKQTGFVPWKSSPWN